MRATRFYTLILTCILFFIFPRNLAAGGWVVVTLDELPSHATAKQPFTVGFMVRQHGVTPLSLDPQMAPLLVRLHNAQTGEQVQFEAQAQGAVGHYQAEITLPEAATWELEVRPSYFPPVEVAQIDVRPAAFSLQNVGATHWLALAGTMVVIGAGLVAGVLWMRKGDAQRRAQRRRWAVGSVAMLLVVGGIAAQWFWVTPVSSLGSAAMDNAAYGQSLFQAKGCVTCHVHDAVKADMQVALGPNLTDYAASSAFLRQWLADPQAVKPQSQMPNLHLSPAEIEALIEFLHFPTS